MSTSISDTMIDAMSPLADSRSMEEIHTDILLLKEKIDANLPASDLLIRIHKDLYNKPECFALLSDDQIAAIIQGISLHVRREIVQGKEKPRAKKNYSADDFDL